MTRTANKKKVSTSPSKSAGRPVRLLQFSTLCALAFILAAVVVGPYLPTLLPDLDRQPEYHFSLSDLQVTQPNPWVPPDLIPRLIQQGKLPETVSLLDPDVASRIGKALAAHPWIRAVESVRITGALSVQAYLDYRRPVLLIALSDGLYPVDSEGVVLPPADFSPADAERLPHVTNIASRPPAEAGRPWPDPVVVQAAKLADVLCPDNDMQRYWNRYGLKAILAPQSPAEQIPPELLTFEIETDGGSRIVWGHAPGSDSLEPSVEQKLSRLESLHNRSVFQQLDAPHRIDIRHFEDMVTFEPFGESVYR